MMIELLEQYRDIVNTWEIQAYDQDGTNFRLKAQIILCDESILHIRQIMLGESTFKYAYHWQNKNGDLLCRWDNAPHWPEIVSYPHHKHLLQGGTETVVYSFGGDLAMVLSEIHKFIIK